MNSTLTKIPGSCADREGILRLHGDLKSTGDALLWSPKDRLSIGMWWRQRYDDAENSVNVDILSHNSASLLLDNQTCVRVPDSPILPRLLVGS